MKSVIISLAFLTICRGAPQQLGNDNNYASLQDTATESQSQSQSAKILSQDHFVGPDGYHFAYETSDGISRQEQGTLKDFSPDLRSLSVTGHYSYVAPDGQTIDVSYLADENGFQPMQKAGEQADLNQSNYQPYQDNDLAANQAQTEQYNAQR